MTSLGKTAALLAGVAALCGAAFLWHISRGRAIERKLAQAARQCRARAEHGDPKAQFELANIYRRGEGVRANYAEAVRWFRSAAEQGDAKAQYNLAYMYHKGLGVPKDYAQAVDWARKAAEQGDRRAEYSVGISYADGLGVTRDFAEAARWYRKAADHGERGAQYALGVLYSRGQGVPRDDTEAVRWYRKAAEQGDAAAELRLAHAYRKGRGVSQNYFETSRWYLKTAGSLVRRCAVRMGWTPFFALFVTVGVLVVPKRRWGRAWWLSWALLSIAFAAYAVHLVSGTVCSGLWRPLGIGIFVALSGFSGFAAAYAAVHELKRRVGPGPPPTIPEAPTGSPP